MMLSRMEPLGREERGTWKQLESLQDARKYQEELATLMRARETTLTEAKSAVEREIQLRGLKIGSLLTGMTYLLCFLLFLVVVAAVIWALLWMVGYSGNAWHALREMWRGAVRA